jgi:hypothetical protein
MGCFDSSDEESDYEDVVHTMIASKKKRRSFLDDSDSDSDSDDDSLLGGFRRKQAKIKKEKSFEKDSTELTADCTEAESQSKGELQPIKEVAFYRETTTDWVETMRLLRKKTSRNRRGVCNVAFTEVLVTDCVEYLQEEDSPLSVNDPDHVAEDHKEVPWYEEDYEELPWYAQPDLDEDDAITALCKKILTAGEDAEENQKRLEFQAAKVEAKVLGFALKLRSRVNSKAAC